MSETATPQLSAPLQGTEDAELVAALRRRDEAAFVSLVDRYGAMMLRVAQHYVRTPSVAEEVVQETWCAVLTGIDRFEGRSRFKTWLFRILTNRAMRRGQREARCLPFSSLARDDEDGPAVSPDRFLAPDHAHWPNNWAAPPRDWRLVPDERLLGKETLRRVGDAIAVLPPRQREVIVLRDVEGFSPVEVCDALGLSEGNQRVLLHRARSRVRGTLEHYFDDEVLAA